MTTRRTSGATQATRPRPGEPAGAGHPVAHGYGALAPRAPDRTRECAPCEIPPFCRTNYFTGRLLTEEDFTGEQRYFRDKLRLHHRILHGWGVACGLAVTPHPHCPDRRLVVEPGVAIDACGYEIVVPRAVEIELPRAEAQTHGDGGYAHEPPDLSLYVCLQYAERDTDFMPAPFDECGCNGEQSRRAARTCESYTLSLRHGMPPRVEDCPDDCEGLLLESLEPCAAPDRADCIPLAVLSRYSPGARVTEEMLDNRSYRPLLPSTRVHDRLLRCLIERMPVQSLTRVSAIGWTHAQEYSCRDFIRFFTGSGAGGPAFEVTFDAPVRPESLTPRVFQAVVTRFHGSGGAAMEIAPSLVWAHPERTAFYLQINRPYAERELHGTWFDVYVTLRCNLVLDEQGRAVDGELVARRQENDYVVAPPTGNGIPGGTLESWIRVRP